MYRTISISVRLVVLSSVWYVIDLFVYIAKRVSKAAPPFKDPSRPGNKGFSSHRNLPGAGAFIRTPSTTTDSTDCGPLLLTAGSAQSCGVLSSARADAYPASGCFLQRPGLESINNQGLLLTAPKDHVRVLTPNVKSPMPILRADPAGLHAGAEPAVSTARGSSGPRHFMVTEAGFGTPANSLPSTDAGMPNYTDRYRSLPPTCASADCRSRRQQMLQYATR